MMTNDEFCTYLCVRWHNREKAIKESESVVSTCMLRALKARVNFLIIFHTQKCKFPFLIQQQSLWFAWAVSATTTNRATKSNYISGTHRTNWKWTVKVLFEFLHVSYSQAYVSFWPLQSYMQFLFQVSNSRGVMWALQIQTQMALTIFVER